MAYAVPTNFAAGAVLTEAQLDVLGNDIVFLANPPKCRVYNSAAISIAVSGTDQALTFDSERFDTDTMHSTAVNTGRITFTTAGTYMVGAHVDFAPNATGHRVLYIRRNGSEVVGVQKVNAPAVGPGQLSVVSLFAFGAGDWADVMVGQTSGGALNVTNPGVGQAYSPEFWAVWQSL